MPARVLPGAEAACFFFFLCLGAGAWGAGSSSGSGWAPGRMASNSPVSGPVSSASSRLKKRVKNPFFRLWPETASSMASRSATTVLPKKARNWSSTSPNRLLPSGSSSSSITSSSPVMAAIWRLISICMANWAALWMVFWASRCACSMMRRRSSSCFWASASV